MPFTLLRERKSSSPLMELTYGEEPIYVSLSKNPVFWQGHEYWPEPTVNIALPKQSGGLSEDPCVITLPLLRGLHTQLQDAAVQLSKPRSAPDVKVRVINLLKASEEDITPIYLYDGVLDRLRRNPEGKRGVVELEFQTEFRYQLKEISLGRRADPECDHIYGKTGCFIDNTRLFEPADNWPNNYQKIRSAWVRATFTSEVFSRQVTLSLDPTMHPGMDQRTLSDQPKGWWLRSYLEKNTVRIPIQEWFWNDAGSTGTQTFVLNRVPPEDWQGALLKLVHGCPQTPEACALRGNINQFGGLGFGIPAYNPVLETHGD